MAEEQRQYNEKMAYQKARKTGWDCSHYRDPA